MTGPRIRWPWLCVCIAAAMALMPARAQAAEAGTIRVGVLQFGAVSWTLE